MTDEQAKKHLIRLLFEMTASVGFGSHCADMMDIDQQDLIYVYIYAKKLLKDN